ncbi:Gfo/Idh/MocA family oxidoreductase [Treponema sp. HNW]|uniref:Gfo/Idh/MocA family protein n=1 Tax=Treponema sp. HNW TaxID=3116654 RepID=UPI003D0F3718
MKNKFLTSEGIQSLIQNKIYKSAKMVSCINIQKNIPSHIDLEKAIYEELKQIGLNDKYDFSEINILKNKNAISLIAKTKADAVLRIFFENICCGYPNSLNYEIIGKNESYIYRPLQQCVGYIAIAGKNKDHLQFLTHQPEINDIKDLPRPNKKTVLAILSLDHPHAEGNHIPALQKMQQFIQVKRIYSTNKKKACPWCRVFGAAHSDNLKEVLSDPDIDAVLITSKNNEHTELIKMAAEYGKDIFCDKPIVTEEKDLKIIAETVNKNHIMFITTYPVRLHPSVLEAKKIISKNKIGKIRAIMATNHGCMYTPKTPDWVKNPKQNGGGSIMDHTVHVADTIRFLTGREFKDIMTVASSSLQNIEAEDISVSHGTLDDGSIFQIDSSWSRKADDPVWGDVTFKIVGEKGVIWLDLYNNNCIEIFSGNKIEKLYPNSLLHQHGLIFYEYVKQKNWRKKSQNADLIDGIRTMELVFASYSSVKTGKKTFVKKTDFS